MIFKLDKRLHQDSILVCDLPLSQLRLINDQQFIWCILVPRIDNVQEIIDLNDKQQQALWHESACLSRALRSGFNPDKLNVAALGNVVSQLHVHHICRFKNDCAWPAPIWGRQAMLPYQTTEMDQLTSKLKSLMSTFFTS